MLGLLGGGLWGYSGGCFGILWGCSGGFVLGVLGGSSQDDGALFWGALGLLWGAVLGARSGGAGTVLEVLQGSRG